MRYRSKKPREGEVVCHNFPPGDPNRGYGAGGFRYWVMRREDLPENFVRCDCSWPVEEHYVPRQRVRPLSCSPPRTRDARGSGLSPLPRRALAEDDRPRDDLAGSPRRRNFECVRAEHVQLEGRPSTVAKAQAAEMLPLPCRAGDAWRVSPDSPSARSDARCHDIVIPVPSDTGARVSPVPDCHPRTGWPPVAPPSPVSTTTATH